MLYVSGINDNLIEVTDTDDNTIESISNRDLVEVCESGITVYGVSIFNRIAKCTPLTLGMTLLPLRLGDLINKWKAIHNEWNGYPVRDYLAELRVGTVIDVIIWEEENKGKAKFIKLGIDSWYYTGRIVNSGEVMPTYLAYVHLERECLYCTKYKIIGGKLNDKELSRVRKGIVMGV